MKQRETQVDRGQIGAKYTVRGPIGVRFRGRGPRGDAKRAALINYHLVLMRGERWWQVGHWWPVEEGLGGWRNELRGRVGGLG